MLYYASRSPAVLCLMLVLVIPTSQGLLAQDAEPDSLLVRALDGIDGEPIALEQVVSAALQQAPALSEAEASVAGAASVLRREKGAFDPDLFATSSRLYSEQPSASAFSGANVLSNTDLVGSLGINALLPTGTRLEARMNAASLESNSRFAALNPQYNAFGEVSLVQPLLSGAGSAVRAGVRAAESRFESAMATGRDTRNAVAELAESLYWRLFTAERDLAVQQVVRENALSLLEEARLRVEAGLVGPNQVENARVFLAQQDLALIDREEQLDAVSDQLAALVGRRPTNGNTRFKPAHGPVTPAATPPVGQLLADVIEANPSIMALDLELQALELQQSAARRNRLPTVDIVAALRSTGLSGTGRTIVFGTDTLLSAEGGDFFESWSQVGQLLYPRWSVGVDVRIPIGNRAQKGESDRLQAEYDRLLAQRDDLIRSLEEEIRLHHRAVSRSAERLEIARTGVEASQAQVRLGLIEYRNGRSTAFELVRLGSDLANTERRYSQELVRAARSLAALQRLTGGNESRGAP